MPLFTMTTMISLHMHTAKECRVARALPSIKMLLSLSRISGSKGKTRFELSELSICWEIYCGKRIWEILFKLNLPRGGRVKLTWVEIEVERYLSTWLCGNSLPFTWWFWCWHTQFLFFFCSLQSIPTEKLVGCWHLFWLQFSGFCLRTRHGTIFIFAFQLVVSLRSVSVVKSSNYSSLRCYGTRWDWWSNWSWNEFKNKKENLKWKNFYRFSSARALSIRPSAG